LEAKYAFWGAVIAALIGVGGTYYFEVYKVKKEEKIKLEKIKELEKNKNARISINNVYVPPINTKIKSILFAKIENTSPVIAEDLNIKVNFGESTVYTCEVQPINILKNEKDLENGTFEFNITTLKKEEEIYIYCQMSNPIFKSILVTGNNLVTSEKYTFEYYKSSLNSFISKGQNLTFFEFLGYALSLIFTIYFTLLSIAFLNKKFIHIWN
jgi:hypothetical protein